MAFPLLYIHYALSFCHHSPLSGFSAVARRYLKKKKKWAGENLLQCLQQMLPSCCTSHAHVNYVHHSKFQISACHAVLVQLVQLLVVLYKIFSAFYSAQFN